MPAITQDRIVLQTSIRYFYQMNGACPGNNILYGGVDGQYLNIEDATNPKRGIDTIPVQDPISAGEYDLIARNRSAPDYPTATVQLLQQRGFYPPQFARFRVEPITYYAVAGDTGDLSDFVSGWESYVKIYSFGEVTDPTEAGGSWDSGDKLQDDLPTTFQTIYSIGPLTFSEKATTEVYSEVIDLTYGNFGNGFTAVYAVANNVVASPGQAPSVFYRTKETQATWTEAQIDGSAATDVPQAIATVGKFLVVVFDDGSQGGYFYAEIDADTGAPGSFSKVQTGFVASKAPKDIYASSARTSYLVGEGGYIYQVSSLGSGVTVLDAGAATTNDLNRIDGTVRGTLVAVGESDTIVYSTDRGNSWAAATATGGGNGLDAVGVVDEKIWWVGDDGGDVYYTTDKGNTWTEKVINSSFTAVQDIVFVTHEVAFVTAITSGPVATIYGTWNGGEDWTNDTPRFPSIPTADRFNRVAVPKINEANIKANWLALGGLAGNGSDGIILLVEPKTLG